MPDALWWTGAAESLDSGGGGGGGGDGGGVSMNAVSRASSGCSRSRMPFHLVWAFIATTWPRSSAPSSLLPFCL